MVVNHKQNQEKSKQITMSLTNRKLT